MNLILMMILSYFQQGTHDSLMKMKGFYYDLVRKQEKLSKEEVVAAAAATANTRMHG